MNPTSLVLLFQVISAILFLGAWEWAAASRFIDPIFIGQPTRVFLFLYQNIIQEPVLLREAAWSLWETAIAFVLGSAAGIGFGLLFATYPLAERFFAPLFSALNALPRIALAPLFLLWFGLGVGSKVALGVSLTFFVVLYNTLAGARSVETDWIVLARMAGASKAHVFFRVTLPSAVPTIFAGLKLGLIYALLGVIAGEVIAAQRGLGQLLSYLAGTNETNGVFAILILLALIGVLLVQVMEFFESRLLRWR